MTRHVISLDLESNGLEGLAFAGAAVLTNPDGVVAQWEARCPIVGPVKPWVAENVLPAIVDMPVTCADYGGLLESWRDWYLPRRDVGLLVVHVLWPVESRFLFDAHCSRIEQGPYPVIDVAGLLDDAGHDPTSVDIYLDTVGAGRPHGNPHHPLYDALAAERAYRRLKGGR